MNERLEKVIRQVKPDVPLDELMKQLEALRAARRLDSSARRVTRKTKAKTTDGSIEKTSDLLATFRNAMQKAGGKS